MTVLRKKLDEYPSQAAAARALGVSRQHLSHVLSGRCGIGPLLLRKLGLRQAVLSLKAAR